MARCSTEQFNLRVTLRMQTDGGDVKSPNMEANSEIVSFPFDFLMKRESSD